MQVLSWRSYIIPPDGAHIIQRHRMIQRLVNPRRFHDTERLLIEQTGITIGFEFVEDALGKLLVIAFVMEILGGELKERVDRFDIEYLVSRPKLANHGGFTRADRTDHMEKLHTYFDSLPTY